jgi:hypothetical protein
MTDKKLIIGMGSGRCGTMSLSHILNAQENCICTHESPPHLDWEVNYSQYEEKMSKILSRDSEFVSDVSFYYLNYCDKIIEDYKDNVKFVILKRKKSQTVVSFTKKTTGMNHWIEHDGSKWSKSGWDKRFPKFEVSKKKDAIGLYWDLYYQKCDELIQTYPGKFTLFNTSDLNDKEKVDKLLKDLGVFSKSVFNIKVN